MMKISFIISMVACFFSIGLIVPVLVRNRRSFVHQIFAVGMVILAFESIFTGLGFLESSPTQMLYWQRLRIIAASLLPGIWLIFVLTYGREGGYGEFLKKQKWVTLIVFSLPIILATFFSKFFFQGEPVLDQSNSWWFHLGWSGYFFFIIFLLAGVLILMNLEKIYRASTGSIRWQIKFIFLGLGSLFAARVYTSSHTILYSTLNPSLNTFDVGALIIADSLILFSLFRTRQFNVSLYLSQGFLYNSFIVIIIGIYLIAVGLFAKATEYLSGTEGLFLKTLVIFLLLLGLAVFILSEEFRQRVREFVSRHFRRPEYDYRREWREFTRRTTSLVEVHRLSAEIVKMIAETFGVSSVCIWLFDESKGNFILGGSTVFSTTPARRLYLTAENSHEFISGIRQQSRPVDFSQTEVKWIVDFKKANPEYFNQEDRMIYCTPLAVKENVLGLLTVNHRITKKPFTLEDFELLKILADQAAGNLLNLRLYDHLRRVKEMEAFQTMSAYIMHDLKNLATTLSMTLQNLPAHFDNSEFRADALRIMNESVNKVNSMCSHLSLLSQKIELKKSEINLNELIGRSLSCLNGCTKISLIQDLQPLPRLRVDPDQLQKVLTNLLLNSNEAVGNAGEIRLTTEKREGWVIFSVNDNGCGISREFMEHSLFRPFKTTKKQGMGIGLFQSKMIVEAHQGRIEVESEEGKGCTFRVMLPLAEK